MSLRIVIFLAIQNLSMLMKNQIKLDRFRIYGARIKQDSTYVPALCSHLSGMTLSREMHLSGIPKKLCSCLSGMTKNSGLLRRTAPTNGFANAYRLTILALLRMFALYRNDEKHFSTYPLNLLYSSKKPASLF